MALIQVKFDNTLQQSDIIIPLTNSSQAEAGEAYTGNKPEVQQTHIYGIQAPLIMINNIVVDFSDVVSFELKNEKILPEVYLTVNDRYNLTTILDTPSLDNELRIQILPKFENKYKKINLTFFITKMKIDKGIIHMTGEYKLPTFLSYNIKSFGKISSYNLFQTIAQESQLGFASNTADNPETERYIYCDNKSYKDLLRDEISKSCTNTQIYEYWIDWWNNLIFADILERYNAVDKDEDMQIWISGQNREMEEGSEIEPTQVVASFTNHPSQQQNELFVKNYKICNSPGSSIKKGTDKVYSVYEYGKTEYMDHLIQDGDVHKDVFTRLEYLGEVYGEQNYLLSSKLYESFKQKIASNETLEFEIKTPLLGIMRGNRVNFMWYINDSMTENVQGNLQETGSVDNNPESNIPLEENNIEDKNQDGSFVLDKTVSGQYLVTKCNMKYQDQQWKYVVTISRPTSTKPKLINENE